MVALLEGVGALLPEVDALVDGAGEQDVGVGCPCHGPQGILVGIF